VVRIIIKVQTSVKVKTKKLYNEQKFNNINNKKKNLTRKK